jgi:hypothetical protein
MIRGSLRFAITDGLGEERALDRSLEPDAEETALRFRDDLAMRIEAYAVRNGISLVMAQKCLIAAGLEAEEAAEQQYRQVSELTQLQAEAERGGGRGVRH